MGALEISHQELSEFIDEAVALAKTYWTSLDQRRAFPSTSGAQTSHLFARSWEEEPMGREVLRDFQTIADHSRPSCGRFFGYVFGSGEPVGAVGDLLASVLNQNVTAWRSAPAATAVETTVVGWLAKAIGCNGFRGSLCGGGSSANLMALAMAREAKLAANDSGASPGVVYASEQVHMSIPKAIALLGIGRNNLRLIAVDDDLRMRPDMLEAAIAVDRSEGKIPIAVVATAGTPSTGAIDPLRAIANIAQQERLWMHVDGAFGGLAAIAVPQLFAGIELADSVSVDPHKWLYQPVDCGCLLYSDQLVARQAFRNTADYVKILHESPVEAFAFFEESMELSRRFRALKLWLSLQFHGKRAFKDAITQDIQHALILADLIRSNPQLELLAPVPLNVVCFRHREKDSDAILRRIISRGRVYISNAKIRGQFALRACFVNHRTTGDDVRAIVDEVIDAAAEIEK